MSAMAAEKALDPQLVVSLVRDHKGQYPFKELMQALQDRNIEESRGRALIWHAVALKLLSFTPDRTAVQLVPDNEGKAA